MQLDWLDLLSILVVQVHCQMVVFVPAGAVEIVAVDLNEEAESYHQVTVVVVVVVAFPVPFDEVLH